MAGKTGARDFYDFEKALHARLIEAEREILGGVMSASDVEADAIEIAGRVHRRVLRSSQTYMTAAGPVSVERWLTRTGETRQLMPSQHSTSSARQRHRHHARATSQGTQTPVTMRTAP